MKIAIILAIDMKGTLGYKNDLPWGRIKKDLQHFKKLTTGSSIIMGRRTYESIGKPLKERRNIVISSTLKDPNVEVVSTIEEALALDHEKDVYFIGGAKIFEEAEKYADTVYLTLVEGDYEGDVFLNMGAFSDWQVLMSRIDYDENSGKGLKFNVLVRNKNQI